MTGIYCGDEKGRITFLTLFHGNGKDLKEWNENRNQNDNSVHEQI